jgi:hypothetical protein
MYVSGMYPLFKRFKVTIQIPLYFVIALFVLTKREIVATFIQHGTMFHESVVMLFGHFVVSPFAYVYLGLLY